MYPFSKFAKSVMTEHGLMSPFATFFVLVPLGQQRVLARKVAHTSSSAYSDDKMQIETLKKDYWHVLYGKILIYWEVG